MVEASNTLSWAHQLACVEDPTQCLFAKQVLASAKQILAHRTQKKEPITPVIFEQLVSKFPGKEAPLSDIRIVTVCLIGFAGFLSLVPRPRPAFRRLQYGKAWRAWYLFSREHDVIGKWQKFSEQTGCVSSIVQPTTRSTLGVYDNHPPLARYVR